MKYFFVFAFLAAVIALAPLASIHAAEEWEVVGVEGFSPDEAYSVSLAFDSSNTPYIAFQDAINNNGVSVMRFNGTNWVLVGTAGFSGANGSDPSIAIDSTGAPYVAFTDNVNGDRISVMRYDGASWVLVGSAGFTPDTAYYVVLALDSNDVPYVLFQDNAAGQSTTVMSFDGAAWNIIGTQGFSSNEGSALPPDLAIDSTDTPVVAYTVGQATVVRYDGSDWAAVGAPTFTPAAASNISLALDSSDRPYVAFTDNANSDALTVMRYDGASWVLVGSAAFSAGEAHSADIALTSSNVPYVAYTDVQNGGVLAIATFDGSAWNTAGNLQTDVAVAPVALAINTANEVYVAYQDQNDSNGATVRLLTEVTAPPEEEEEEPRRRSSGTRVGDRKQQAAKAEPAVSIPLPPVSTSGGTACPVGVITRTLKMGSEGEDVRSLQQFLNCSGFILAETGVGSKGNETTCFGLLTQQALIKFQEYYAAEILAPLNLTQGTGIFGEWTHRKARQLGPKI